MKMQLNFVNVSSKKGRYQYKTIEAVNDTKLLLEKSLTEGYKLIKKTVVSDKFKITKKNVLQN